MTIQKYRRKDLFDAEQRSNTDWIITGPTGNVYIVDNIEFSRMFEPIPSTDPADELLSAAREALSQFEFACRAQIRLQKAIASYESSKPQ